MSGIIINEDNSHYFFDRGVNGANIEKLKEMTAHYCVGQVTEVTYNFMAQKANVSGLNVEPIWYDVEDRGEEGMFFRGRKVYDAAVNWLRGAKTLEEKGIDPYKVWLEETRRLGRKATISMRMNDSHDLGDKDHFFHCEFWRSHPELRLKPAGFREGYDLEEALDYTFDEVREYKLNIAKAVLERYDLDGLEIDWMRFGLNVGLRNCDAGREALTDFHRQVRALADKAAERLGHPVEVTARVSASPEDAFARGMDVMTWVREGLVQSIIPTAFFLTTDTGMPIALWRSIIGDKAEILAGLEILVRPFPASDPLMEMSNLLAGQAADYFYQGADRIYLFNHMDSDTGINDQADFKSALNSVGTPETAYAAERRHVITYHDYMTLGVQRTDALPAQLPANGYTDYLRLSIGPKPEPGRKCTLIVGFDSDDVPEFDLWLNGTRVTGGRKFKNTVQEESTGKLAIYNTQQYFPKSSVILAEFDAADAVVSGTNMICLQNKEAKPCKVTWVEIAIEKKN